MQINWKQIKMSISGLKSEGTHSSLLIFNASVEACCAKSQEHRHEGNQINVNIHKQMSHIYVLKLKLQENVQTQRSRGRHTNARPDKNIKKDIDPL